MKYTESIRLFSDSRPCTIRLKNTSFLPNTAALIPICKPSSQKENLPLFISWRLTPFHIIFIWLFLNRSRPVYCAKTFLSPSSLSHMTEAISSAQHDGERADRLNRWFRGEMRTKVCLNWGGGGGAWVNFYEASMNSKLFSCFQTQLVFLSMNDSLANLFAATLTVSNNNSLY